jgi:DNA-directed RNA polymerase specialized sigma24 family protein
MTTEPDGSVTRWIGDLVANADPDSAAQKLWGRYFGRLVHLARARYQAVPRRAADEEDVALSAFDSFCRGAAKGRFPRLGGRDDLWRILITITSNKAYDQWRRESRKRRGGGRVVGEEALVGPDPDVKGGLDQVMGREPTPEFAAQVADECGRLLAGLRDETLRQIALLRMEGYSNDEIASRIGCGVRTVERKLDLIRKAWEREAP